MKTFLLYLATALAEIVGCYLPYLWLRQGKSAWLLVPALLSLAVFAWLLTLHDTAAGRVYAAYGGVYIGVAVFWLWAIDGVRPTAWDIGGVLVALAGMGIIMFQPRSLRPAACLLPSYMNGRGQQRLNRRPCIPRARCPLPQPLSRTRERGASRQSFESGTFHQQNELLSLPPLLFHPSNHYIPPMTDARQGNVPSRARQGDSP